MEGLMDRVPAYPDGRGDVRIRSDWGSLEPLWARTRYYKNLSSVLTRTESVRITGTVGKIKGEKIVAGVQGSAPGSVVIAVCSLELHCYKIFQGDQLERSRAHLGRQPSVQRGRAEQDFVSGRKLGGEFMGRQGMNPLVCFSDKSEIQKTSPWFGLHPYSGGGAWQNNQQDGRGSRIDVCSALVRRGARKSHGGARPPGSSDRKRMHPTEMYAGYG